MTTTLHHAQTLSVSPARPAQDVDTVAEQAWRLVAPLWTLDHFVAVNPYGGLTERPFPEAVRRIDKIFHARALMPVQQYRRRMLQGAFGDEDLAAAASEVAPLHAVGSTAEAGGRVWTYVEALDRRFGTRWAEAVVDELSQWCAARFDRGQAAWAPPGQDLDLWPAFLVSARVDLAPELRGLTGFRRYAATLPADPRAAVARILDQLGVPDFAHVDFCARALATVKGWAGHVRFRTRQAGLRGADDVDEQMALLAIRLAFEGAAHASKGASAPAWSVLCEAVCEPHVAPDEGHDAVVWQHAFERGYRRRLLARLTAGPSAMVPVGAPRVQAVFCIDVRSEVLRRHLEQVSSRIQTVGFAGFFGFPIEWRRLAGRDGGARCPALIAPSHRIREVGEGTSTGSAEAHREGEIAQHRAAFAARLSTVASFSFAETAGAWFGLRILTDALHLTSPKADGALFDSKVRGRPELAPEGGDTGLDLAARVRLAEGALRGMGLVANFADVVLVCGHGSRTSNNAYASGLDCGACGGHAGDVNARVAAMVFNDPEVRDGLRARGIDVPEATRFVAGLHETTTDRVELFDTEGLGDEALAQLKGWLTRASAGARRERLRGLGATAVDDAAAELEVTRRSADWSEVRPEWGLANNAAFVAARRTRTRGLDLEGRVFLHDYDPSLDSDGTWLTSIMTAPLVVATWINMQYYASSVDPEVFGAGNKALHNVVGRLGVQLGSRGDLQVGLPLQSVHDGEELYHEPLRLQVVVEAWPEDLDAVIAAHSEIRDLVEGGWITLVSWQPGQDEMLHRHPGGLWIRAA